MDLKPLLFSLKGQHTHGSHQEHDGQEYFWSVNTNTLKMNSVPSEVRRDHPNSSEIAPDLCQSESTFTLQLN